jgi:hypothetical protein
MAFGDGERMIDPAHEAALFRAFLTPAQARKFLALQKVKRGRDKILRYFPHNLYFIEEYCVYLESNQQSSWDIARNLRSRGAGELCYAMSEAPEWDGRMMPLERTLGSVVGFGYGTLLSCIRGRLAFYEGEGPSDRHLLVRPTSGTRTDR